MKKTTTKKPKAPEKKPAVYRFESKSGIAIEIPAGTTIKELTRAGLFVELCPPKWRAKK